MDDLDKLVKGWLGMLEEPEEEEPVAAYTATAAGLHVADQLGLLDDAGRSGVPRQSIATLSLEDFAKRKGLSVEDLAVAGQLGLSPDDLLQEEVA